EGGRVAEGAVVMPGVTVTNLNDSGAGSLRAAVGGVAVGGVITFEQSLAGGTITFLSPILVDKAMTIVANVPITASGGGSSDLFYVDAEGVTLDSIDIRESIGNNGAIYVTSNGGVTITNSSLVDNGSNTGTVLRVDGGEVLLSGSVVARNEVNNDIVYVGSGSTMIIEGTSFYDNVSSGASGAIYNEGMVEVRDSTFISHSASAVGGILNLNQLSMTNSALMSNTGATTGGIYNLGVLTMSGGSVDYNSGNQRSGGIYMDSGSNMLITGTTFSGNRTSSGEGAGIYLRGMAVGEIYNATFHDHKVTNLGGVISNYSLLSVTNSAFISNSANLGGAIINWNQLNVTDSWFISNVVTQNGGGIYNLGTLWMQGGGLVSNQADGQGGGVFLGGSGAANMENVSVRGNQSGDEGGGIYVNNSASAEVNGGEFVNNTSSFGGAISNNNRLSLTNSSLISNTAVYGGGIMGWTGLTMTHSSLISNVATSFGGGLYMLDDLVMRVVTFTNNEAEDGGGGIYSDGALSLSLEGGSFNGNRVLYGSGGGVYVDSGTVATITGGVFFDNVVSDDGAGLFSGGELVVVNSTFLSNTAESNGGGLYNYGIAEIDSSSFISNVADSYGGGIINEGTMSVTNSTVGRNRAGFDSGGIYNDYSLWLGRSTVVENGSPRVGNLLSYGDLYLYYSVVAEATEGVDCQQRYLSGAMVVVYTLIQNNDIDRPCGEPWRTADPLLEELANDGGAWVYRPQLGSVLINADGCTDMVMVDQRGVTRPQYSFCDIGAVEYDGAPFVNVRVRHEMTKTIVVSGEVVSLVMVAENYGPLPATGVVMSTTLLPELTGVTYESSAVVTATAGMTYTWDVGDMMVGDRVVITVTGVVSAEAGVVSNVVRVGAVGDATAVDNEATVSFYVASTVVTAVADGYDMVQDTTLNVSTANLGVLGNDEYDNNLVPTLSMVTDVHTGTLQLNSDGTFMYTPPVGFVGWVSFSYQLDNSFNQSVTWVAIRVDGSCAYDLSGGVMGADVMLDWQDLTASTASFDVYRHTEPYFALVEGVNIGSNTASDYSDVAVLPLTPLFYKVNPVGCGVAPMAVSNEVGAFTFEVVVGN
ncbi:MAG TPA: choice-of-anchor Q domain-containing protein, partial [Anaerolineae bacterium]|nr:choice-of-anchor Q domain-containing protein [Anaerolineae bacterium]